MSFFELLQVALGHRERLSCVPSAKEWTVIYDEAKRQAVAGILLHGIDRLPTEQRPSQVFLLQWIGLGQMIRQRNQILNQRCGELIKMLDSAGLQGTILKGQGIALVYDEELQHLRQSGDIDVYVNCGLEKTFEFAKSLGQKEIEWDYKHLHLNVWNGIEVEMHYRVEVLLNLMKNHKLQNWFREHDALIHGSRFDVHGGEIVTPTITFNVFYILLHIYRHFLYEGVGLRQIIDYYYVLKKYHDRTDTKESINPFQLVRQFGMERFARGLMWVMVEKIGMPIEWTICDVDEKEGKYILEQVMAGGNFGHYDERLQKGSGKMGAVKAILTHNLHLMTHYPSDTLWAPIWIVWHKCWKIKMMCGSRVSVKN